MLLQSTIKIARIFFLFLFFQLSEQTSNFTTCAPSFPQKKSHRKIGIELTLCNKGFLKVVGWCYKPYG